MNKKFIFGTFILILLTIIFAGSILRAGDVRALSQESINQSAKIQLSVDLSASRHAISPYIYGLNFAKESFAKEIDLPVLRWGGNATSRYNWKNGNTNSAMDWYFENMPETNSYTGAVETHTQWIDQNIRTSTKSIINIPMIGFVAKDDHSCSFSIAKYGYQQSADTWRTDCGNGILPNSNYLTGNATTDTSQQVDSTYMKDWVSSMVSQYGSAANGGVKFYTLDNEPDLWGETHRDVHPDLLTYDELATKMIDYSKAIKSSDPGVQVLGYSAYGWESYWYSENDAVTAAGNDYTYFPDYQTHGNQYHVPWILTQMKNAEQTEGIRLLDYLDLHYYTESGAALSKAGNTAKKALRLRSTRSLWDPTYTDESWIGGSDQPVEWRKVMLIARMHNWIDTYYPGTKLAITEYNFGGLENINGALAQADVLGIFGREGVDLANLWNYPNTSDGLGYEKFETLPGAYAFRMFRNYDGLGGKFGDLSVSAQSSDQSKLAIYAANRSSDGVLTIIIINKTGKSIKSTVLLNNYQSTVKAKVFKYSSSNLKAIKPSTSIAVKPGGFTSSFPTNSITLIVIP